MEIRRTKTYIAFDGDADLMSYRNIQGWSKDYSTPFEINDAHELNHSRDGSLPDSIINQLRERLKRSKQLILIVGSQTNRNRKGILKYELNYALKNKLPITLIFKGHSSDETNDENLWNSKLLPKIPGVIKNYSDDFYCLVTPFTRKSIYNSIKIYTNNNLPNKGYTWCW